MGRLGDGLAVQNKKAKVGINLFLTGNIEKKKRVRRRSNAPSYTIYRIDYVR